MIVATHVIVSVPVDRWHEVINNPVAWVEAIEEERRDGGRTLFDTWVLPCYSD